MNLLSSITLRAALFATACATGVAAQDDPLKVFRQSASRETRAADQGLKERNKTTEGQTRLLIRSVAIGKTQPSRVVSESLSILLEAIVDVDQIVDGAARAVEADTSAVISSDPIPPELLVGQSGLIDGFQRRLGRSQTRSYDRTIDEIRKTMKEISERTTEDNYIAILLSPAPIVVVAPAAGQAVPVTDPSLRILAMIAGSSPTTSNDGRMSVAGTGDPSINNGQVNIQIEGPGLPVSGIAFIDTKTSTWKVDFPQFGAGALREGNYRVRVDQGGAAVTSTIGVP